MGYSSNDTYLAMGRFMASIKKALDRSYIKDIYDYLNRYDNINGELNLLYEFAELLNLDNGEANPTILKSAALNLMTIMMQMMRHQCVIITLLASIIEKSPILTKYLNMVGDWRLT